MLNPSRVLPLVLSSVLSQGVQAADLPRVPPTAPDQAAATFEVQHGFRMELLAAEPLVTDPVAMTYDENGRAYVVEMLDYPHVDKAADVPYSDQAGQPSIGRVRLLEDLDGDGRFDRSEIFADKLSWPAGIVPWKGGVYVGSAPDIWYLKDTDGDRKADVRLKVFTGFKKVNVQAVMNNLQWGLDHQIYGAGSGNGGVVEHLAYAAAKDVRLVRRDFRFDPRSHILEELSGGARFGNTFDAWGNRFLCNIRAPSQQVVLPDEYLRRNPLVPVATAVYDCFPSSDQIRVYPISREESWRAERARMQISDRNFQYPKDTFGYGFVTSSSGITIYRGSAYPPEFHGNAFTGEVASNLFYRQRLDPQGVTFQATRVDEPAEFVRSTDNWFRPVNFVNAPDGTLHVLDMYREVVEHPWSVPDELRKQIDFRSGSDRGRIWRLAPPGFTPPKPPRLGEATTEELVALLESPNGWHRETAHRLLFERHDQAAIVPLQKLVRESASPLARMHALWSLLGLAAIEDDELSHGLTDANARVREHAVRLSEGRLRTRPSLRQAVQSLAGDEDPRVRFQVAFSLGNVVDDAIDAATIEALAEIARRDVGDPWVRAAVLSSVYESSDQLLTELLHDSEFTQQPDAPEWFALLAQAVGGRGKDGAAAAALAAIAESPPAVQLAVVTGLGNGLKRSRQTLKDLAAGNEASAQMLDRLMQEALVTAENSDADVALRVQALALLEHSSSETSRHALLELLDARQPAEVQSRSLKTLAVYAADALPSQLLERWQSLTPSLRDEAIGVCLSRPAWTLQLIEALEAGRVKPSQVAPGYRYRLLQRSTPEVQQRAAAILNEDAPSPRNEVIAAYALALEQPGDADRGREVFRKVCATCHKYEDIGADIGPPLSTIRHRTRRDVLTNILDPNREVAPDHLEYLVVLSDGRTVAGMIGAETASSLTLRRGENQSDTILREDIEQIQSTGNSIMPEGLEKQVTPQQMADLLTYLLGGALSVER